VRHEWKMRVFVKVVSCFSEAGINGLHDKVGVAVLRVTSVLIVIDK